MDDLARQLYLLRLAGELDRLTVTTDRLRATLTRANDGMRTVDMEPFDFRAWCLDFDAEMVRENARISHIASEMMLLRHAPEVRFLLFVMYPPVRPWWVFW